MIAIHAPRTARISVVRQLRHVAARLSTLCLLATAVGCVSAPETTPQADAVYDNARIWTGDPDRPWAGSMAVLDGRIVALGAPGELARWRGRNTEFEELEGRFVTPGFQDSHVHVTYQGSEQVDLAGAESLEELQARIRDFAQARPERPWIIGFGWAYSAFPDQRPLASHLDDVIADRPVLVTSRDGHMALANTRALALASIDENTADPINGRIVRDADGRASGELQETAKALVTALIPPPTEEERYRSMLANMRIAAAEGLTALHEAGATPDKIRLFERAAAEGRMLQRVEVAQRMVTAADRGVVPEAVARERVEAAKALRERLNGPFLRARSIKGMMDGTIDATTAGMFDSYVGSDSTGILFWELENLKAIVALYDAAGFQVILHAIGDRTISEALDAFDHARAVNGVRDSRHRVEHAELPRVADVPRFAELGVVASTQPMFAYPDETVLGNFAVLLGPHRARYADSFAMWDDAGVTQVFGSDHPVMTLSVLKGIEAAVTRMTEAGTPRGGWFPEGRISVESALRHYTRDAAWSTHDDAERGTLTVGKVADFVVLSENILEIDPTRISETRVLRTVMNGRVTFDALTAERRAAALDEATIRAAD